MPAKTTITSGGPDEGHPSNPTGMNNVVTEILGGAWEAISGAFKGLMDYFAGRSGRDDAAIEATAAGRAAESPSKRN